MDFLSDLTGRIFDAVRKAVLTGISFATGGAITATDTVLVALGKLQVQMNGKVGSSIEGETFIPDISVQAASTANVATLSGPQTIDGVALIAGNFVLLKAQTTASQNGVYTVLAGAWTRTLGMDTDTEIRQRLVLVIADGTVNKMGYEFVCTNASAITVGTTAITFGQVPIGLESTASNIKINGTQAVGSLQSAARADHVHPVDTSRAALAAAAFTGAVSARSLANTVQTLTLSSNAAAWTLTSGNSAILSMVAATAACTVTMASPVAGATSRLTVTAGAAAYALSVGMTGVTFIYNGTSSATIVNLGALPATKTADYAFYWVSTTICSISLVSSDAATNGTALPTVRLYPTASATGVLCIGKLTQTGSYIISVEYVTFRVVFVMHLLSNYPVIINILLSTGASPTFSAQWSNPYVLLKMNGATASQAHFVDIQRLTTNQDIPLLLTSETGTNIVIQTTDKPYILKSSGASTVAWNLWSTRKLHIDLDGTTGDVTVNTVNYLEGTTGFLSCWVVDGTARIVTLNGDFSYVYNGFPVGASATLNIPANKKVVFELFWDVNGIVFITRQNSDDGHVWVGNSLDITPATINSKVPLCENGSRVMTQYGSLINYPYAGFLQWLCCGSFDTGLTTYTGGGIRVDWNGRYVSGHFIAHIRTDAAGLITVTCAVSFRSYFSTGTPQYGYSLSNGGRTLNLWYLRASSDDFGAVSNMTFPVFMTCDLTPIATTSGSLVNTVGSTAI